MSAKNPAGDDKSAATVVADDSEDALDTLKRVGGSQSNDWNHVLGDQALQSLWIMHSDKEVRERQFLATIAGLIGIAPQDEIESMIAAQLIAAHNATMECYRRAMIGEQTLEGRRDNLSQANKLSRTYAVLLDALNRHRGKGGQQKVTVEHVHVHAGGQAVVGTVETPASQVTGFGTFEDTIDIASGLPEHVGFVRPIRNQSAIPCKKRKIVHCRQAISIHQRDDCSAMNHVKAVWHRNQPAVWLARQSADGAFDVGIVVNLDHNRLDSERRSGFLNRVQVQ